MSNDALTVSDIINERPSLRQRAILARQSAVERAAEESAERWHDLRVAAADFARNTLLATDDEIDSISYNNITLSPRGEAVEFKLESVRFRVKHQRTKVFQTHDHEAVYDLKPVFEMPARGPNGWTQVVTLADVGRALEAFK